jgi:sucrose-6-phosphate hydrolase SacC (GH32 family)
MVPASLAKSMKQASSIQDKKKKTKTTTKSKKNKSISKKQEKTLKKESKTMLPEERAFQLSLPEQQEAMQVDDVSHSPFCVERKHTMLYNIKYISKRLQVQGFALEEEQAYQNLVQPYDSFLRKKVELNLAAMKRQVERDELPTEEAYQALMDEAALFMAHG